MAYLEEEFYPTNYFGDIAERDDNNGGLDDPALLINEDNILDIRESVRQTFVAAKPIAPVCRESCKGLCPICSINLNESTCQCSPDQEIPEWAKSLRSLEIN